ncbi:MAG: hypothetical protein HC802_18155 [Caldilineaceae bacterium]|nr:hypothetical protein [Caldilineaceae bacterium]
MRRFVAALAGHAYGLLPIAVLVALAGYFGPWVDHPVAGLVVTGLDLGEYVKFLPVILSAEIVLWREGFTCRWSPSAWPVRSRPFARNLATGGPCAV